jgi:hypothetical protein
MEKTPEARAKSERTKIIACDRQSPGKCLDLIIMIRATRDRILKVKPEPGATLYEREICEAPHGAMFLTISLRGKDGTPWQGVA